MKQQEFMEKLEVDAMAQFEVEYDGLTEGLSPEPLPPPIDQLSDQEKLNQFINPALQTIGEQCIAMGMSPLFLIDYDNGERLMSLLAIAEGKNVSPTFMMALLGARSGGNFDALVSLLRETGTETNSVALNLLGFPSPITPGHTLVEELKVVVGLAQRAGQVNAVAFLLDVLKNTPK